MTEEEMARDDGKADRKRDKQRDDGGRDDGLCWDEQWVQLD